MKKKIIAISIIAVLAVIAVAGASLAYLTDTDSADNTFTVGNVQIQLVERQRKTAADGSVTFANFTQGKILYPIVGSAEDDPRDKYGMTTANNYVDKIVWVWNTGNNAAYVRVLIAVPALLEGDTFDETALHWDVGDRFDINGRYATPGVAGSENQAVNEDYDEKCVIKDEETTVEIDDIVYNIYSFTYTEPLNSGALTAYPSLVGFYLDEGIDNYVDDNGNIRYTLNGEPIEYDLATGIKIPVFAQAVQANGFDSASAAFEKAALPINPWE